MRIAMNNSKLEFTKSLRCEDVTTLESDKQNSHFYSIVDTYTKKNLAQMLLLAVELLPLPEESCATMHLGMLRSLCG